MCGLVECIYILLYCLPGDINQNVDLLIKIQYDVMDILAYHKAAKATHTYIH